MPVQYPFMRGVSRWMIEGLVAHAAQVWRATTRCGRLLWNTRLFWKRASAVAARHFVFDSDARYDCLDRRASMYRRASIRQGDVRHDRMHDSMHSLGRCNAGCVVGCVGWRMPHASAATKWRA